MNEVIEVIDVSRRTDERRARRGREDLGQAAVLVVTVAAVLLSAMSLALVELGGDALDRTTAQTAADAAALAGVEGGRGAAEHLAGRHGGTIVTWSSSRLSSGDVVTVTVRVGDATATARATNAP